MSEDRKEIKHRLNMTFLGTAHHRTTHHTLLTEMHNAILTRNKDDESVSAFLFDGVGCVGTPEFPTPGSSAFRSNASSSTKSYADDEYQLVDSDEVDQGSPLYKKLKSFRDAMTLKQTRRKIFGAGLEDNLFSALELIRGVMIEQNVSPGEIQVTLQGFSRGADSCVRLAHDLRDLGISVNLMLIDPVPGPGRFDDEKSFVIPDNVANCEIMVMANEHNPLLKPHDLDSYVFEGNPILKYHVLPGNHGAGTIRKPGRIVGSDASYKLVQDSLLKFHIASNLLNEDHEITSEYGLVNGKFIKKDLQTLHKYLIIDLSDIRDEITQNQAKIAMEGEDANTDGILIQNDKYYFFDITYHTLEEINLERLAIEQQSFLKDLKDTAENIQDKSYSSKLYKEIRNIVSPLHYKTMSDELRFKTLSDAFLDMQKSTARSRVRKGRYKLRNALKNRDKDVSNSDIFLSAEHFELFIELYPNLYGWCLQKQDTNIQDANEDLAKLSILSPSFKRLLSARFGFNNKTTELPEKHNKTSLSNKSLFGQKIKSNPLNYHKISLRNIINRCRHMDIQDETDKQLLEKLGSILTGLNNYSSEVDDEFIRNKLKEIDKEGLKGFVAREVARIICDPNQMLQDLRKNLDSMKKSDNVNEKHKQIIAYYSKRLLGGDFKTFSWENYLQIREDMIHLNAQLNKFSDNKENATFLEYQQKIIEFYKVDYGADTTADKLISELRSYQRWSLIFCYFPMFFGWFDSEKYAKVDKLVKTLETLNIEEKGDDLQQLNIVVKASLIDIFTVLKPNSSNAYLNRYLIGIISHAIEYTTVDNLIDILKMEDDQEASSHISVPGM